MNTKSPAIMAAGDQPAAPDLRRADRLTARNLRKRAAQLHQRMRRIFRSWRVFAYRTSDGTLCQLDLYPHIGCMLVCTMWRGYSFGRVFRWRLSRQQSGVAPTSPAGCG